MQTRNMTPLGSFVGPTQPIASIMRSLWVDSRRVGDISRALRTDLHGRAAIKDDERLKKSRLRSGQTRPGGVRSDLVQNHIESESESESGLISVGVNLRSTTNWLLYRQGKEKRTFLV